MIVIPMAGLSRRFAEAGYPRPKYMLDLHGRPVFDYAISSFRGRFGAEPFLFVLRDVQGTADFVAARLAALGISGAHIVSLDAPTQGQAQTVAMGLARCEVASDAPLTIFNIDSFRPGFHMTPGERAADGYLEVFHGEGDAWSFVAPADPTAPAGRAERVVEKDRISDLCCTGLYYFRTRAGFAAAYEAEQRAPSQQLSEHYVAPIYNQLLANGRTVLYRLIASDEVVFCGVPSEYERLLASPHIAARALNAASASPTP
ncbi:MAG: glycosyltransferase family 2 protein [Caulobacterales bacterium]|nr:glycosyltransferase family 2 protein [Caulobacterales bacterium]